MIYLILHIDDLNRINKNNDFKVINTNILNDNYVLVVTNLSTFDLKSLFFQKNIKTFVFYPYISKDLFDLSYGKDYAENHSMQIFNLKYSFFNYLMCSNQQIIPPQNNKHYLLSDLLENKKEYLDDLVDLNEFIKDNKLKLKESSFRPSLKELLSNSIKKALKEDVENSSDVNLEEQNDLFTMNVVTDFLLKASEVYNKKDVQKYILKEFYIEKRG